MCYLAILALVAMAIGIVVAKPVIEEMAVIWATTIRFVGGAVLLALFAVLGKHRNKHWSVFRPSSSWKYALPGSILGTYFAMVFWIAGFKYTYATIAARLEPDVSHIRHYPGGHISQRAVRQTENHRRSSMR